MIKSEAEYQKARSKLKDEKEAIEKKRTSLMTDKGYTAEQAQRVLDPYVSFHAQLEDEVLTYEKIKRGDIQAVKNFYGIGRALIAMRLYADKTQKEVAEKLEMDPGNYNRMEKNEFHGANPEFVAKVMGILGFKSTTTFERVVA